ncbi:hypothetical protein N665_0001s0137 [Sinapis alba]|nr:hypothetical protein N665_0001s0137 [Sinapis alba]
MLRTLAAQTTTYIIWKQHNNFLHNHQAIPATTIFRELDRLIRNTIFSRRHCKKFMAVWIIRMLLRPKIVTQNTFYDRSHDMHRAMAIQKKRSHKEGTNAF